MSTCKRAIQTFSLLLTYIYLHTTPFCTRIYVHANTHNILLTNSSSYIHWTLSKYHLFVMLVFLYCFFIINCWLICSLSFTSCWGHLYMGQYALQIQLLLYTGTCMHRYSCIKLWLFVWQFQVNALIQEFKREHITAWGNHSSAVVEKLYKTVSIRHMNDVRSLVQIKKNRVFQCCQMCVHFRLND